MKADRVAPGLYRVVKGFVNSYAVEGDEGLTLIDCGTPKHAGQVADAVAALGRQASEVRHILLTHHHPDHTGSLATISTLTGASVHVHRDDAPVVRGEEPIPGPDRSTNVGRYIAPPFRRVGMKPAPPAPVHHEFDDDQVLPVAGGIRVVHTPGHTKGHCAFLLERDGGVLIVGDAARNIGGRLRSSSVPAGALVGEDMPEAERSFHRLGWLDFRVAVFGHGEPIMTGASARFRAAAALLTR